MKLQSQETRRFEVAELQALAKRSYPFSARLQRRNELFAFALAGLATGGVLALFLRWIQLQ